MIITDGWYEFYSVIIAIKKLAMNLLHIIYKDNLNILKIGNRCQNITFVVMINAIFGRIYSRFEGNNRIERIWKLAIVEFKKKYYNTRLGVLWNILGPVFQITIYYFIFKYLRETREDNFVFFLFLGLISFSAFNLLAVKGLNLIKSKKYLLANIQFNKNDLFWSTGLAVLLTYILELCIYFFTVIFFDGKFNLSSFWIIGIIVQLMLFGLATSMILSVINMHFKDITNFWRTINFTLFWTSGIIFSGHLIINEYPISLYINPLLGLFINIRKIFLYGEHLNMEYFMINSIQISILFTVGLFMLKRNWHYALEKI